MTTATHSPLLDVQGVRKTYRLGRVRVPVLHGVSLAVDPGEWVAILGASGSGKSTLLHLCGGLDRPDKPANGAPAPSIRFDARDVTRMPAGDLDRYRCRDVGFVFQFYHLLPELTVLENVAIGAMVRTGRLGWYSARAGVHQRARDLLTAFGLGHRLTHRSAELSGGERQRVAIARALINQPRLLLADEPTGNLDRETGGAILDVLADLRLQHGLTVLMVTHDTEVAARSDRVVRILDGVIEEPAPSEPTPV